MIFKKDSLRVLFDENYNWRESFLSNEMVSKYVSKDFSVASITKKYKTNELSVKTLNDSFDYLMSLPQQIASNNIDVFQLLPINKNGTFHKTKVTVLRCLDFGFISSDYGSVVSDVLCLVVTPTANPYESCIKLKYCKVSEAKLACLQNIETPKTRVKKLKDSEQKEGYIYEDELGSKYLFVGRGHLAICYTYEDVTVEYCEEFMRSWSWTRRPKEPSYIYLPIKSKRESLFKEGMTYDEFFNELCSLKHTAPINFRVSKNARKFVKEIACGVQDKKTLKKYYFYNGKHNLSEGKSVTQAIIIKLAK